MSSHDSDAGEKKPGGLGTDATIPPDPDGIAAGVGDEPSNFNPEEDPESAASDEDETDGQRE